MHFFKRYFLLAAIAISLLIPAVVFTKVIYIEPISTSFTPKEDYSLETYHAPRTESINYTYWSLLSVYSLGVLFFSLQFFKNLYQIKNTIQNNPKQQTNNIIKVLLSLQIVPHTFFNYIFLNKQKFEANEIPPAVLLHEETHAKQKHSIDILVLEILQIVFWFNPLIYLFKKSIKLNHEFLADSAVLNNGLEKSDYQKILLAFSSNAAEPQLANAINYSSIKKRFTVMKKETSRKVSLVKSFLIIPIAAILLLGFSEKEILEIQKEGSAQEQQTLLSGIKKELENVDALKLNYTEEKEQIIELYIKKNAEILIHNTPVLLKDLAEVIVKEIRPDIKLENIRIEGLTEDTLESEFMFSITTEIRKANIKQIKFYTSEYIMDAADYKDEIEITPETIILDTNRIILQTSKIIEYENLAQKYLAIPVKKRIIRLDDLNKLENLNRKIGNNQSYPIPQFLPENIIVDKKTILVIVDKNQIYLNTKKVSVETFKTEFNLLTKGWESDYQSINSKFNFNETPIEYLNKIENEFKKTSFSTKNRTVNLFNIETAKSNLKLAEILRYNTLAKKYNTIPIEKRVIPLKDLNILETIYRNMSPAQKEAAQPFPECLPQVNQEGATKKQIASYNNLSKKYNTMMAKGGNIRILKSDVDQLKFIHGIMSEKQKASAQPFPDFPEPPKPPKVPNTTDYADKEIKRIIETHSNTLTRIKPSGVKSPKVPLETKFIKDQKFYQNVVAVDKSNAIKINGEKHYYINDNGTSRIYHRFGQRVTNKGQIIDVNEQPIEIIEVVEVPSAPEPPTPPSPLDYVINATKKGATFMYEGEIVSSDKAIDLLKNNKELNIESRTKNGKQIVRITKDPVTIE
tara:strand:- start:917 stop:3490 length:2574 start_codon:yes stop_codon:yes gene_type:complete